RPSFLVAITNRGARAVALVSSLDGSTEGMRYPVVSIRIEGPEGGFPRQPMARCGNMNTLSPSDFVFLGPAESFDPFAAGWVPPGLQQSLRKPGRYKATFCYSTMDTDVRHWLGDWGANRLYPQLSKLFREVPLVELTAATEFIVTN